MALHWRASLVLFSCSIGLACSDDGVPQEGTDAGSTSGNGTDNPTASGSASATGPTGSGTTGLPTTSSGTADTDMESGSTGSDTDLTGTSNQTDTDTDPTGSSSGSSSSSGSTGETDSSSSSGSTGGAEHYEGTFEGTCEAVGIDVTGTLELDIMGDGTVEGSFMTDIDSGTFDGTVDGLGAIDASGMGMVSGDCTFTGQIDMAGDIDGMWACPDFQCTGTWEASPT